MTRAHDLTRPRIVAAARSWIGTPYHHQASRKGIGTDCLGLVRGIWRELFAEEPEVPPPYSRDWAEASGVETMLEGARRHFDEIEPGGLTAGDLVVFRLRPGFVAKHAGILAAPDKLIHALEGAPVSEVHFCKWWRRRIAGAFRFPGVV